MSRGIPPVRTWRVRYYRDGRIVFRVDVETINKQFAKWISRDHAWANEEIRKYGADRISVSLVKQ